MSDLELIEEIAGDADRIAAHWRGVEREWATPKDDLTAMTVRRAAKHKAEAAEEVAAAIRRRLEEEAA